jgi:hypothetical protein
MRNGNESVGESVTPEMARYDSWCCTIKRHFSGVGLQRFRNGLVLPPNFHKKDFCVFE